MSAESAASPKTGVARFTLNVQGRAIEVSTELPEGPVPALALLPVLQGLSNSLSEMTVERAARAGKPLSCHDGCGACCRHAVPIAPAEARLLSEWMAAMPGERRSVLRERFRRAAERLEESGIAQEIRDARGGGDSGSGSGGGGRAAMHDLGMRYFALGIACPFLEEERCSIYEIRPMRCREYLVVSPAENCAEPASHEIVSVKPPVLLSQILERWSTDGDQQAQELVLLTMLDEWMANHPAQDDQPHRTAPELLGEFLRAFARDAQAGRGGDGETGRSATNQDGKG